MEIETQNILVVGSGSPALDRVVPLLRRARLRVRHAAGDAAAALLERERFDLLIVRLPSAGASLARLLAAAGRVPAVAAAPRVLVLADVEAEAAVRPWLGRGVDRAVSLDAPSERLMTAVADLLPAAARADERVALRLPVSWSGGGVRGGGVTVDVSRVGMLVAGEPAPPPGAVISVTLDLSDDARVTGTGEVTRREALPAPVAGFAAKFVAFAGDGRHLLERALAAQPRATSHLPGARGMV